MLESEIRKARVRWAEERERERIIALLNELPENRRITLMANNKVQDGVIISELIELIKETIND